MKNRVKYISFILFSVLSFGMFLGGVSAATEFTETQTLEKGASWDRSMVSWMKCTSSNTNVITATENTGKGTYTFKAVGTGTAVVFCTNGGSKTGTIKFEVPKKGGASSINKEIQQGKSSMIGSYKTCTVKSGNVTLTNPNGKGYYINANADGTGKAIVSCMKEDDSIELYSISIVAAGTSTHPNGSNYNPDNNNTSSGTGGGTSMTANACLDPNSKGCAQIDATTDVVDAPTKYTEAGFCTDSVIKLTGYNEVRSDVTGLSTTKTYTVTAHCTDDSSSTYTAYCIDPAVKGPTEAGWEYTADEQLDLNSDFGKAIYCLYKNSGGADYTTIQDTARLLMVKYGQPFLGIANGPYKKHALMYQSYGGSTTLMNTVESCISTVQNNSMQMSFTQLTNSYENGNVTAKYKLILKNPKSGVDINSVNIVVKDVNGGSIGYTKTIENIDTSKQGQISADVILVIPAGSNCTLNVTASLKYYDADDVRNVFFARAKKNNMAQRFLVINNKGNAPLTLTETTSLNLSDNPSCVPNTPENLACVATNGFLCTPSETVATVYEGKSVGASADWDACIVDKSDPNGNEYTIQEAGAHNYCKVVCKEDYAFKMPGDLGTIKQGRYISINLDNRYHAVAGVAAQRTCVSTDIKVDAYQTRAVWLKQNMLEQLNLYNYYKGMYDKLDKDITLEKYLNKSTGATQTEKNVTGTSPSTCSPNSGESPHYPDDATYYFEDFDFDFEYDVYKLSSTTSNSSILKADFVIDKSNVSRNTAGTIGTIPSNVKPGTSGYDGTEEGEETTCFHSEWPRCVTNPDGPNCKYSCSTPKPCSGEYSFNYGIIDEGKSNYETTKEKTIYGAMEAAKQAYEDYQAELRNITEEINMCTTWSTDYQFDPEITFTYDESSYMEMMNGNNKLKMDGEAKVNSTKYYCSSDTSYAGVFGCSTTPSDSNRITTKYYSSIAKDGSPVSSVETPYYNYRRIGSIDKYGDVAGQQFIYFKSMVPFYTYPSKGFVTANDKKPSSDSDIKYTLVDIDDPNRGSNDADGLIYPISLTTPEGNYTYTLKFANIGQYFNSSKNLGRIMGTNGYLSGTAQDQFVCTYKVEPIIPSTDDENKCATIAASDKCKSNPMSDECFYELLNSNCCDYLDLNKDVTVSRIDDYNAACPRTNTCSGYRTINYTTTIGNYDSVKVTDNGKLQFYVKSVSLNNLFPNGDRSKGLNWMGSTSGAENNGQSQDISEVIKDIEDKGEQIYGDGDSLIYSIKLTPTCMAHVREYNKEQETSSLGFADYTLTTNYKDKSSGASDNSYFLKQLESYGCVLYKNKLN